MASNPLDDIIPSQVAVHSRAVDYLGAQTVYLRLVVQAIMTAIVTGLFTATIADASTSSKDIQWVMERLREAGYTCDKSTTNLVVNW